MKKILSLGLIVAMVAFLLAGGKSLATPTPSPSPTPNISNVNCQATLFAGLPAHPVMGLECGVADATTCQIGTAVSAGTGTAAVQNFCGVTYDGLHWMPAGAAQPVPTAT